jgi:hypothetical protein
MIAHSEYSVWQRETPPALARRESSPIIDANAEIDRLTSVTTRVERYCQAICRACVEHLLDAGITRVHAFIKPNLELVCPLWIRVQQAPFEGDRQTRRITRGCIDY